MKLVQTILSKLRRSGIFRLRAEDPAPTELKNFFMALATKMPRLRHRELARNISLIPWLQPGVRRITEIKNRFNGLSRARKAVETAEEFFARAVHRAEATVLIKCSLTGFQRAKAAVLMRAGN